LEVILGRNLKEDFKERRDVKNSVEDFHAPKRGLIKPRVTGVSKDGRRTSTYPQRWRFTY